MCKHIKAGPSCFRGTVTHHQSFQPVFPPKEYKTYQELVDLLESRGMQISDRARAVRKLEQIGYYRLSGFWYPCRSFGAFDIRTKSEVRGDFFQSNIDFNLITDLYLFDKKLRQLMLDAIERVEIHIRSIIAHELGSVNPLAYEDDSLINPRFKKDFRDRKGRLKESKWKKWLKRHNRSIKQSKNKEDSIKWHIKCGRAIPVWVAVETWDFGCISSYFEILKVSHQREICARLDVKPTEIGIFKEWLRNINILRNRCAHHARIWNRTSRNPIQFISNDYFDLFGWAQDHEARFRLYCLITILWYLVKRIGPSSEWIKKVADLIDSKPYIDSCPYTAMGFPDNNGFPRWQFGI